MGFSLQQMIKVKQNTEKLQTLLAKKLIKISHKSYHFINEVTKFANDYDIMNDRTNGAFNEKQFFRPLELKEQMQCFYQLLDDDKLSYHMKKELFKVSVLIIMLLMMKIMC